MLGIRGADLRIHLEMTPKELARLAGVSAKAVYLFEHDQPVLADDRRKILTALYVRKIGKYW
jgi:DNA-binding XRE family transcriptional regulator